MEKLITPKDKLTSHGPSPAPSQVHPSRPNPSTLLTRMNDRGKAPKTQRTPSPNIVFFRCHKVGHFASQCPTRSLYIGELDEEDPKPINDYEEEVYEAGLNLVDQYEGDEETIESLTY